MAKQNFAVSLRCKIDEKAFSRALFLCRFFTALPMIYLSLGALLYWREFMVNTHVLGFPFAVWASFSFSGLELFLGLFLLLGWHTRWVALAAIPLGLICALIFFAGGYNNFFVALCILQLAPLSVLLLLGPGVISLDYKRSQRAAARHFFRG